MSTKALENKAKRKQKFRVRQYTRCELCGRSHAVYRKFKICRICFRTLANEGKSSALRGTIVAMVVLVRSMGRDPERTG